MTVDFAKLLSRPLDQLKPPVILPDGLYIAVIKARKLLVTKPKEGEEGNPYVRFDIELTAPGEGHDPASLVAEDGSPLPVMGTKLRRDYFFTERAEFRFREMAASMGIDETKSAAEAIEELVNQPCIVLVGKRAQPPKEGSNEPPRFFNECIDIKGRA